MRGELKSEVISFSLSPLSLSSVYKNTAAAQDLSLKAAGLGKET